MSIFWILAIIAVVLIVFLVFFGFRGAGTAGWGILKNSLYHFYSLFSCNGYFGHYQIRRPPDLLIVKNLVEQAKKLKKNKNKIKIK